MDFRILSTASDDIDNDGLPENPALELLDVIYAMRHDALVLLVGARRFWVWCWTRNTHVHARHQTTIALTDSISVRETASSVLLRRSITATVTQ